ncbi:peptide deformylase [Amycolatopsis arida]|nr:peptide deformylase [Amycolatopsis arida]
MPLRATLQLGHPALREPCAEVDDPSAPDVAAVVTDLRDTLADWVARTGYGRGIAAPQIGVPSRLVYLDVDGPWPMVNPRIVARSEATWAPWDSCLSFSLEFFCRARRAVWVDVEYLGLDGRRRTVHAENELGELLQHELDHLDGVLAVDRMTDASTLCLRGEFERRHRAESPYRR